jgi:hypothetical protein
MGVKIMAEQSENKPTTISLTDKPTAVQGEQIKSKPARELTDEALEKVSGGMRKAGGDPTNKRL